MPGSIRAAEAKVVDRTGTTRESVVHTLAGDSGSAPEGG